MRRRPSSVHTPQWASRQEISSRTSGVPAASPSTTAYGSPRESRSRAVAGLIGPTIEAVDADQPAQ
ncbi:hypothetical protein FOF52_00145 [Thermobifida alba]|uniref:Uncharacterized protein n=1 Tax=Thermobifida alba TaxID=53522 RepID=A0ABY4KWT9_THEAE|nr:hypothetical protein [Thermobifida alba]UPT19569.1 hypothetical protein FOF52_00145 [Thermobifida alba]